MSRDPAIRALCYYYFPPCGNITHFEPPNALCQDTCIFFTEVVCQERWQTALSLTASVETFNNTIFRYNLHLMNCNDPGSPLGLLPHCCSDAGIDTGELSCLSSGNSGKHAILIYCWSHDIRPTRCFKNSALNHLMHT